jgi:GR25 family glycosyltransferase involved in LPS biosynthesis
MDQRQWSVDTIPAFCINMDKRKDRWIQFSAQPGLSGLPKLKRYPAVDGSKLDIMNDTRIPLITKHNILYKTRRSHEELNTKGGIGCALSHMGIWEWQVKNNVPVVLIFEDDARVTPDFVPYMNQVIQASPTLQNPSRWDFLNLANTRSTIRVLEPQSTLSTMDVFVGMQCYLITLPCAKKFLKEARNALHLHIDIWIAFYKKVHGLDILCLSKYMVRQRSSKTDIQDLEGCALCNITNDFPKTHRFISVEEFWLLRAMELALGITAVYALYQHIKKV